MLSRKAKYALRALSTLALAEPEQLQARRIAQGGARSRRNSSRPSWSSCATPASSSPNGARSAGIAWPARGQNHGRRHRAHHRRPIAPIRCASVTAYQPCADCIDPQTCALRDLMGDVARRDVRVIDHRSLRELAQATQAAARRLHRAG
jgi:DNA-binding IscR family transcriptional regulator